MSTWSPATRLDIDGSVLVLQPDGRDDFHLARSAGKLLHRLLTTLWMPPGRPLSKLVGGSGKRWHADIPAHRVTAFPTRELVRLAVSKVTDNPSAAWSMIDWRNRGFDLAARDYLDRHRDEIRLVVSYPSACLETIKRAKHLGIKTAVFLPLAHPDAVERLYEEDRARNPEWAAAWDLTTRPAYLEERYKEELRRAAHVICPSEFVRDSLEEAGLRSEYPGAPLCPYGGDPHPGFDINSPMPERRSGPVRFLFAGYLSQRKGLGYLLEAFSMLPPGAAELTLAGTWFPPARAIFSHLPPGVRYIGHQTRADLYRLMLDADALVLPSLCEGSALVLLEATGHCLPNIATYESGGHGGDTDHRGSHRIARAGDSADLARILYEFLDPEILYQARDEAHVRCGQFTWADSRHCLHNTLASLIAAAP